MSRIFAIGWGALLLSAFVLVGLPTMAFAQTPQQGPPGSVFTVSAGGFRSFELVESIELGGVELLGSHTIITDDNGAFTAEGLQVPGLDPGSYALVVKVGTGRRETSTVRVFEITGPRQVAARVSIATGLAPLLEANNLEGVFYFRNGSKDWLFYVPRPGFTAVSTLMELRDGEIYWIESRRNQEVRLNGKALRVSCTSTGTPDENCWNLVVW